MEKQTNVLYLTLLTIVAALGGLLFGFDIAIITGAGPFVEIDFSLNKIELGWAYSSLLFGCMFGSVIAGRLTDTYGRRSVMQVVAFLFALTCLGTALANGFVTFFIIRFLGGLAVGAVSVVSPMYIAEVSPPHLRGRLVSVYQLSIVTGIVLSYFINYLLKDLDDNWRWMFATGIVPSVVFFILLLFVPETPRFLYKIGKKEHAFNILKKISGQKTAHREIEEIKNSMQKSRIKFKDLFKPGLRKVMIAGFGLAVFVQVSGINAVIDYAPIIFKNAGWDIDAALFATFGLGIVNVLFTFVSIFTIDILGRKTLYIIGSSGMAIALVLLSILSTTNYFEGNFVLIMCIMYLMFFAACIGPVFWTLISEIFPNYVRGTAMTVPVLTQWFFNGLVVLVFPWGLDNFRTITFAIIALMALGQLLFTIKIIPETKNKTLEEIEAYWKT
jgi:MFS transporter, SP family, arabinose:H+ symporter